MNSPSDKLAKLDAQRAALELKIRAVLAKEKERSRREETRGKIVLGGAVLALFISPRLLRMVANRDRERVSQMLQASAVRTGKGP
jgi:hypothetical protein